jgi:hypothetical protein
MLSLTFVFWVFVLLFAIIGAMRGWARELLVCFAAILALFIISVLERFIPVVRDTLMGESRFWVRAGVIGLLVFFGYQTPNIPRLAQSNRFVREHLQDVLLGVFLGAVNGYLIFGTLWFYMHDANYPFAYITPPSPVDALGEAALKLIPMLPPAWLASPLIYFAVAVAFIFVLVVFI